MIKLLVKNRLRGLISGMLKQGKNASKGKIALFAFLFIYLFAAVAFMSASFAYMLGEVLITNGFSWLFFAIFTLASFTAVFLLSIFETKSELFDCKDNDLLLAMPIPEKALVISRTVVVLIFNYLIQTIVIAPAIVVYAIISHDALGVCGAIIVSLFTPLLATALSSGVGYALAYFSKKIGKSTAITLVLSLGFLTLYFWGYSKLISGMENFLVGFTPESIPNNLKLLEFIGNASLLKIVPLISLALVCVVLSALTYFLISARYIKLAIGNVGTKKVKYTAEKTDAKSPLFALTAKELKKFFTSAVYMLNSGIGLIFTVVLSVFLLLKKSMLAEIAVMLFGSVDFLAPALAVALVLLSSMNTMSASALSLEGKNLWILKTVPVDENTVVLSKVLPQIIVTTPPVLLSSVLLIIASGASPIYWLFVILTPLVANAAFAFLGLCFNILAPKFEFNNEAQPIKQSMAVFLTMITQTLLSIAAIAFTVFLLFKGYPLLSAVLGLLFFVIVAVVAAVLLFIPCKQKYIKM